jgi:steroid 5-alpha reductase family enzyme
MIDLFAALDSTPGLLGAGLAVALIYVLPVWAAAADGWWTVYAPIVMSVLLMRFSGVGPLEKDLAETKPKYQDYVRRTNVFFPGPPG